MRIMLVTRVWPTQRGGGMPFVAQDRANELARLGHDVHVVTTSFSKKSGERPRTARLVEVKVESGVTVHYTPTPAHQWSKEFADECLELERKLKPDILHSESFDRENLWWVNAVTPFTVTMHGFAMGAWLTKWNEYRALRTTEVPPSPFTEWHNEAARLMAMHRVLAVSKWEYRMLRDQYGLRDDRLKLVYNPIAPYFFDQAQPVERKGLMCAAISGAKTRGFDVAEIAAKEAGVDLIRVYQVERQKMPVVYDSVKGILLPTAYAQGFDLTIAEGRARRVPAIMTATGSYLDEAKRWDQLVGLDRVGEIVDAIRRIDEMEVPEFAAEMHHPTVHVCQWLEAVS